MIKLDQDGYAYFEVEQRGETMCVYFNFWFLIFRFFRQIRPEEIGAIIIKYLRKMARDHYDVNIPEVVISVPAEFDQMQRNYTSRAVELAGLFYFILHNFFLKNWLEDFY